MSFPASNGARPVLSILIVNFNSTNVLRDCLDAIAGSTIADRLETIVVDNASTDFDLKRLTERYPWVRWLPQETNTTYTGGNNIAFAHSSADIVLMLNPDTRVEPETLERAVAHMDDSPNLAGLGAYLIGPDGQLQRYYRRLPRFADLPVMLFEPIFRTTRRGRRFLMMDEPFDQPTPVENPPGAFLMLRRSVVGDQLLDAGYFNFVSDLELCDRLTRAGTVMVFPNVRCHHLRAGAGVGTQDQRQRLRLYHDFTWGLRRYFAPRVGWSRRALLNVMLILYWFARLGLAGVRKPQVIGHALTVAASAISGRPARYEPSDTPT